MSSVDVQFNQLEINRMLKSPNGLVGRHIHRLGVEFVREAKRRAPVGKKGGSSQKLRASIHITMWPGPGLSLEAGSNLPYAMAVEKGSRARVIVPKKGKVLRFPDKAGKIVYTPKVNYPGSRPNPFLWDSLKAVVHRYS